MWLRTRGMKNFIEYAWSWSRSRYDHFCGHDAVWGDHMRMMMPSAETMIGPWIDWGNNFTNVYNYEWLGCG